MGAASSFTLMDPSWFTKATPMRFQKLLLFRSVITYTTFILDAFIVLLPFTETGHVRFVKRSLRLPCHALAAAKNVSGRVPGGGEHPISPSVAARDSG